MSLSEQQLIPVELEIVRSTFQEEPGERLYREVQRQRKEIL